MRFLLSAGSQDKAIQIEGATFFKVVLIFLQHHLNLTKQHTLLTFQITFSVLSETVKIRKWSSHKRAVRNSGEQESTRGGETLKLF